MTITQKNREIAVETPLGDDVLLLVRFSGAEQLGHPFEYDLELASEKQQIKTSDIIGQNVTIRLNLAKDKVRYFNGFISSFTQALGILQLNSYRATVVPWLWFLTRTADCRIFQNKTVPDIIKKIFKDRGFTDFEDALTGNYREWENCVQYRETDFNFVSRLMEQEGMYYFFKHEKGKHSLVLADSASAHESYPEFDKLKFQPADLRAGDEKYISDWVVDTSIQPGFYALNDFDFKNTKKDLQSRSKIACDHAAADYEIYDYPGEYIKSDDGQEYAKKRIQELHSQYEVITAGSDVRGICTGCTFTLTNHPLKDQNKKYLITSANHSAQSDILNTGGFQGGDSAYSCNFTAIDAKQPFRSPSITPKPSIPGPQTAMVVGPSNEEIYTDEFSRVKVQFHWDRYGKSDENSSCWIRVSQAWAGKKWGAIYIPRIGQEVIVEFLEGDPDHPIITGRVYNGQAMPPYELPGNKTQSGIKSRSSKEGSSENFNEIRLEDKKDSEQILIHAEKDLSTTVENDETRSVGHDRTTTIDNDEDITVKGNRTEKVEKNEDYHVVGERCETVDGNRNLVVKTEDFEKVGSNRHTNVTGDHNEKIGGKVSLQASEIHQKVTSNMAVDAGQQIHVKAGMALVIEAGMEITIKAGANFIKLDPAGVAIQGTMVMLNSGGAPGTGSGASPTDPKDAKEAKTK